MKKLWNDRIKGLWYSHPRVAIALTLVGINLVIIALFTGILSLITGNGNFDELAYIFTYTMSSDGVYDFVNEVDDLKCFIVKVVLALIQMVIFSGALIGFTTDVLQTTIDARINNLGKINLRDHYVFLNWSDIAPRLIYDLSFLEGHKNVIVLADKEREEIINSIESIFTDNQRGWKGLRVFVKQGDPMSSKHLDDVSLDRAKYIGIFLSDTDGEEKDGISARDIGAIKTLLTMMNVNVNANIVVEAEDSKTVEKIDSLAALSGSGIEKHVMSFSHNALVGYILGRSLVNPIYDDVYKELLDYDGVELYGIKPQEVEDALYTYCDCIPVVNYDDDDEVASDGTMSADHLYVLAENLTGIRKRAEKRSFVRPLPYREERRAGSFTVFIVSQDKKHEFIANELDKYAATSNITVNYKTYGYGDDLERLMEEIATVDGPKKVLLLSVDTVENADADVFLAALELKLRGNLDPSTEVYAEISNPMNVKSLQNLGVVSVIVSTQIVSLFMLQLLTHENSKKFFRDLVTVNDGEGNDGIDIDIARADELLEFQSEYLSFGSKAEFVQSFYIASGRTKMCLGIRHGDKISFLCNNTDKHEELRIYSDDDLILAVY